MFALSGDSKMMKCMQDNNGFTLIELMVAIAVAAIFIGVVGTTYQLQVRSKNTQEALTDLNQAARAALGIMAREIRTAGCDPDETAGAAIVTAASNQLNFTRDIANTAGTSFQPDGLLNGPNEQVIYNLYVDGDGNQNLGRNTGAGPQPLVRNVDALDFVYLDANGVPTGVLADMRSVEITLVARAGAGGAGFTHNYVDNRAYTNQQGTVILPAQNDSFRRLLLTTSVNLLNIWQ
jgi:type IV pilus assembly protein PilW